MKKILFISSLMISQISSFAQGGFLSNNNEMDYVLERSEILYADDSDKFYTDVRPYSRDEAARLTDKLSQIELKRKDSFLFKYAHTELIDKVKSDYEDSNYALFNLFYKERGNLLSVNTSDFYLKLNPVFNLSLGSDIENKGLRYQNSRGLEVAGSCFQKLNYYLLITENQIKPFDYVSLYGTGFFNQNQYNFNPYYNYWKSDQAGYYDFSNTVGYVDYTFNKYLSMMLGQDRNFYGYGYRSLFLGDNNAPYFQIKTNLNIWKLHYQFMTTQFTGQYVRGGDQLLPKKYGAFHLLTFKPSKHFDIGFYEGIIFHRADGFELNYLNPIIYYHSIEHALGSPDNSTMGIQSKVNIARHFQLYCQILLDDLQVKQLFNGSGWWGNKYGGQLGFKWYDVGNVSSLDFQTEVNAVRPYTYSHYSDTTLVDNFTHYNQALAHPLGANFIESITSISFRPINRLKLKALFSYATSGSNLGYSTPVNYGGDIFVNTTTIPPVSDFDNKIGQGNRTQTLNFTFNAQYMIYHNIIFTFDYIYRKMSNELGAVYSTSPNTSGFMAGIRINFRRENYLF